MSDSPYYTDADRAEFDRWIQQVPSGGVDEALWNLMRLQISHDLRNILMVVEGTHALLESADERALELLGAARELRDHSDRAVAQVAAAMTVIEEMRLEVDRRTAESQDDRQRLHRRIGRAEARLVAVGVAVLVLIVEAVVRYTWPLVAGALLSVAVALLVLGGV